MKGKKGQANQKNIKVRAIGGVINLKAMVAADAFAPNLPGSCYTIHFRLF